MRSALGLAVENSHIAVTFIPLGCSGARIDAGFLSSQRISECPSPGTNSACPGSSPAQIDELKELMAQGASPPAGPQHRSGSAHDRGQRHPVFRADRQCHHRIDDGPHPARARRRHRDRRGLAEDPRQRSARQLRQAARRAQALCGRRSFARAVRHLRQPRAHLRQYTLRRRARRLRRSSGLSRPTAPACTRSPIISASNSCRRSRRWRFARARAAAIPRATA